MLIPGAAGDIELIETPAENNSISATAIICHPHPLFGGTMNNKVVTTLARVFHELGLHTIRFNFRGVGKSSGKYDEGRGEVEDLLAIAAWIKKSRPLDALWLAGFSFGAYVATKAATQLSVAQLVTIAPQVSRFKEEIMPPITCPWVLVQGEKDEVVSPEDVFAWIETLDPKPQVIRMPEAGHFFHGQLLELREKLTAVLSRP